jgi:hypothetical protein
MSAWMYDDVNDQVAEHNRAERQEQRDARVEWDPRDDPNYPDKADLAEMAYWDRIAERREAGR